jgi:hypothetical protein
MKKIEKNEFEDLALRYKNAKIGVSAEDLEIEYACLKVLFKILETDNFRYTDFSEVSFLNHLENTELELISEKFNVHKVVRYMDFVSKFKLSSYSFLDFLHANGAINEKKPLKHKKHHNAKKEKIIVPKIGEYYLCQDSGYWKIASKFDVDRLEKARIESLYMFIDGE